MSHTTARLADNAYGKRGIRLLKVRRDEHRHDISDVSVEIRFEGDLEAAYTAGDNTQVLPTDTMRNSVYALAAEHDVAQPDEFAAALVTHFLEGAAPLSRATVTVHQRPWQRIEGVANPGAFTGGFEERRVAIVTGTSNGLSHSAGIDGLSLLKTTGSAFRDFLRDELTTLPDADDRVLQTVVTARWPYTAAVDYGAAFDTVRTALIEAFTDFDSESVQHGMHAMGAAVLDRQAEVSEIFLSLPNRHNLPPGLERLGITPDGTVLMPVDEPSGVIEATITRG